MTREQSWEVEGETLTLLRHITSLGYTVSVLRLGDSLFGVPGAVEMHAVDHRVDPPQVHLARVVRGESNHLELDCAVLLAEMVGIDLEG